MSAGRRLAPELQLPASAGSQLGEVVRSEIDRFLATDCEEIHAEIVERLRAQRGDGEFPHRISWAPRCSEHVADEPEVRLVVIGPDTPHRQNLQDHRGVEAWDSPALEKARGIVDNCGAAPRRYRNMVVFAAVDDQSLDDLEAATAVYLSLRGVLEQNVCGAAQAEVAELTRQADDAVDLRIAEAYRWALVPRSSTDRGPVEFEIVRLRSGASLALRVSSALVKSGALLIHYPPQSLRSKLDRALSSLWSDGDVRIRDLWKRFASDFRLPRLRDIAVLVAAAEAAPALADWRTGGFATAKRSDDSGRYVELTVGSHPGCLSEDALVVDPAFAVGQLESDDSAVSQDRDVAETTGRPMPVRYRGLMRLDPADPVQDFNRLARQIIERLTALAGTRVEVTVEVNAEREQGIPDSVSSSITHRAQALRFDRSDWE